MRLTLVILILSAMVLTAAIRTAPAQAAVATSVEQSAATSTNGGPVGIEIEMVKWASTQSALAVVLVIVLASYRRDVFRKVEAKQGEVDALREEKRMLIAVLDKNADASLKQAVALQANTEATKLLAQNVNNLAERRSGHRP